MTEEDEINERLNKFSDRQIVVEVLEMLDNRELKKLVLILERNYKGLI